MATRAQLHNLLLTICDNVYFQSPESFKMEYPCIKYERNKFEISHANNKPYKLAIGYRIDIIYKDPDSTLPISVAGLPSCEFETHYKAGNLYHDVFNIYY